TARRRSGDTMIDATRQEGAGAGAFRGDGSTTRDGRVGSPMSAASPAAALPARNSAHAAAAAYLRSSDTEPALLEIQGVDADANAVGGVFAALEFHRFPEEFSVQRFQHAQVGE